MDDYYYEKEKAKITESGIEAFTVTATGKKNVSVPHLHSSIEILFCTAGSLLVNLDGQGFEVNAGEMILLRSNIIHSIYSTSDGFNSYYVLKAKLALIFGFASKKNQLLYMLALTSKNKEAKTVWHTEECAEAFSAIKKLLDEQERSEYGYDIAVTINAVTVLLKIMRDTRDDTSLLNTKDDLINTRISHAEQDLLSTDKSITDIAADCGFNNTSYFISTFKKMKNVTPSELRKNHGEDYSAVSSAELQTS